MELASSPCSSAPVVSAVHDLRPSSLVSTPGMLTCLRYTVYTFNTLLLAWVANNVAPDSKRSAALPLFISIANISGIAASQVYPNHTAPRFILGNAVSMGMELAAGCGIVIIWFILRHRNNIKQKQRADGVTDNGKVGDRALDFEYIF